MITQILNFGTEAHNRNGKCVRDVKANQARAVFPAVMKGSLTGICMKLSRSHLTDLARERERRDGARSQYK